MSHTAPPVPSYRHIVGRKFPQFLFILCPFMSTRLDDREGSVKRGGATARRVVQREWSTLQSRNKITYNKVRFFEKYSVIQ